MIINDEYAVVPGEAVVIEEDGLFTVGTFYRNGFWDPESDWETLDVATERMNVLNGLIPHECEDFTSAIPLIVARSGGSRPATYLPADSQKPGHIVSPVIPEGAPRACEIEECEHVATKLIGFDHHLCQTHYQEFLDWERTKGLTYS